MLPSACAVNNRLSESTARPKMAPAGISDINFTLDIDADGGNEGGAAQAKREKTIIHDFRPFGN